MSIDSEPQKYEHRHAKRVTLDSYTGVASDLMELNDPVADNFMRVSDMRADVFVVKKPEQRVLDYDQLGHVRVAKMIKVPKLDFWRKEGATYLRREQDSWLLAVDDQQLARDITANNQSGQRFDDAFVGRFNAEVVNGLRSCLIKEKLLNSGRYNISFTANYCIALPKDLLIALYPVLSVIDGQDPLFAVGKATVLMAACNIGYNAINLLNVVMTRMKAQMFGERPYYLGTMAAEFSDPFVKNSMPDLLAPPVPLDRLVRGSLYLNQHGNKMISHVQG